MSGNELAGRRILVVEDETMIVVMVEQVLAELGAILVGPVSKLDTAIAAAREEPIDAAILDVTIRGGHVYPVAQILLERRIPFVLASGYGDWSLPEGLKGQPRLTKPYTTLELATAIRALFA